MKVYILLDRTGSMADRWNEALSAINGYVKDLAKKKTRTKITLALFDSYPTLQFDVIRKDQKPKDWKEVSDKDATPRGLTPLYDAIGSIVNLAEESKPKKAIIAVMTDGYENASKEVSREDAKASLGRCRKKGWEVLFLGADFDAIGQASQVGTGKSKVLNMTKGHYGAAAMSLSAATRDYVAGAEIKWSEEDRKKASGM